jgi:hypothetical protein
MSELGVRREKAAGYIRWRTYCPEHADLNGEAKTAKAKQSGLIIPPCIR